MVSVLQSEEGNRSMHKLVLLAVVLSFLCVPVVSMAQEAPIDTSQKVFTPAEKATAQAQLQSLVGLFGVETPKAAPAKTDPNSLEKPSVDMSRVADRALDMVTQLVSSISVTLEKVSPQIWKIFVKQQYAAAISELIVPWTLFLVAVVFSSVVRRKWKCEKGESIFDSQNLFSESGWRGFTAVFIPYVVGFICVVWGATCLADAVPRVINPEYYFHRRQRG